MNERDRREFLIELRLYRNYIDASRYERNYIGWFNSGRIIRRSDGVEFVRCSGREIFIVSNNQNLEGRTGITLTDFEVYTNR